MLRTRDWTIVAAAVLAAATLVWSLAEPPWRDAVHPAAHEGTIPPALGIPGETIVPAITSALPDSTRSTRLGAVPRTSVHGTTEAEANQALAHELRGALLARDLVAAKELLADATEPQDAIDDLVDLVLNAPDPVAQLMAVRLLASIPGEAAIAALLRVAYEPDPTLRVRTQALIGLSKRPADAVTLGLVGFLDDEEREMRLTAFRALGLLGNPDTLHTLESALWYEEDANARRVGFEALARFGTSEAVESLLFFLEQQDAGAVADREAIVSAIGMISRPEAVPELLNAMAWAEDPALRAAIIRTLATSADVRAFDVLLDTVQDSESSEARLQAINGLGRIGDRRALPVLRELEAGGNESERRFSQTAVQRIMLAGT